MLAGALDSISEADGESLAGALVSLTSEQAIHLPGLGWLQMKRYAPYPLRPATMAKYLLFYIGDPNLYRQLRGERPEHREFASERDRLLAWIHACDPEFDMSLEDPDIQVVRHPWSDAVAAALQLRVVEFGTMSIPRVGTIELVDDERRRRRPVFRHGEGLAERLQRRARAELPGP
jgi:hypothetical protein